jgi:hypothetical protein
MQEFARYQWIDYRNRSVSRLQQLAQSLYERSSNSIELGLETVPEDVQALRTPDRVTALAIVLRNGAAAALAGSLLSVALPGTLQGFSLNGFEVIASLIQGLLYFQTASDVLQRRVTLNRVVAVMVSSTVLVGGATAIGMPFRAAISTLLPSFIGLVFVLAYVYTGVKRWLPTLPVDSTWETMAAEVSRRIWLVNALWLMGSIAVTLSAWISVQGAS